MDFLASEMDSERQREVSRKTKKQLSSVIAGLCFVFVLEGREEYREGISRDLLLYTMLGTIPKRLHL